MSLQANWSLLAGCVFSNRTGSIVLFGKSVGTRGVTIHLVMIWFVLQYTACDTFHDTIFAIYISDILFIQELSIDKDLWDRIYG